MSLPGELAEKGMSSHAVHLDMPGLSEGSAVRPLAPRTATLDAALLALSGCELPRLRERVVEIAALRMAADAVWLLDLAAPDRRIVNLAGSGAARGLPRTASPADLELLTTAHLNLLTKSGEARGGIAGRLRAHGFAAAVGAGLGVHGVPQLLVAARRRGRFGVSAGRALAALAAVLAGAERQHRVAGVGQRRFLQQAAVAGLGQRALAGEDLGALIEAACRAAVDHLDAEVANVLERAGDGLVVRGGAGVSPATTGVRVPLDETFAARVMTSGEPVVIADVERDPLHLQASLARDVRAASLAIVPIQSGRRPIGVLGVVSRSPSRFAEHDITFIQALANVVALAAERARVQTQLRLSVEELRKSAEDRSRLLAHIVEAQEEERRRIADDIHDDSVQVMTAVALRLATLRRRLRGETLDPILTSLERDVRQSIARLRHLMFVLRPPGLEHQGVAAALQAFLAQVADEAGLTYGLEDRIAREPDTEARIVVYRIAQEAVSNILKHARATRIEVTLEEDAGGILVSIGDDGVGFDPSRPEPALPGHLGLLVMCERAEQTGGWCRVDSQPGRGTTVRYRVGSDASHHSEASPARSTAPGR